MLPGQCTPRLQERVVRLGTWLPVAQAAEALTFFPGVTVAAATVRRLTEGAGAVDAAVQTAAVETLEREWPALPPGPRVPRRSVDGAMVPLPHGEWAAGKPLALGVVSAPVQERGAWVVQTAELSYGSRLPDAETCGRLALVETPRRGTETAQTVCAVRDGAAWIQGFVDLHRPDAVRIVDVPHALGSVAQAGQAVYGEGTTAFTRWVAAQRQTWHAGNPAEGWAALRRWAASAKRNRAVTALAVIQESLHSVEKRRGMVDDGWYQARGYPMGSGSVESANKLVVERRRTGTGMHWARAHVNPMGALRTIACRARWQEAWRQMAQHRRQQCWHDRVHRQTDRRHSSTTLLLTRLPSQPSGTLPSESRPEPQPAPRRAPAPQPPPPEAPKRRYRPPPDHPWRPCRLGRARPQRPAAACVAKL